MDETSGEKEYESRLAEWGASIDALKARAEQAGEEQREQLDKRIAALEEKRERAAHKLEQLRDAGHHALAELKVGLEMAFDDLQDGIRSAGEALSGHKKD